MFLFSFHLLSLKYFLKSSYKILLISLSDQNDSFQNYSYFSGDCIPTLYLDSILICMSFTQCGARTLESKKKKKRHCMQLKIIC